MEGKLSGFAFYEVHVKTIELTPIKLESPA